VDDSSSKSKERTMKTNNHNSHPLAMGLLCGIAVGAALGLLFAPKPGRDLRHDIGDSARKLGHQSKAKYDSARRAVTSAVHAGKDAFHRVRGNGEAARA
jgi:gas vesicle protein